MQTQEVEIQPNVEVSLKTDMEMLDEVVVVGYGTGKKLGSVVGSVSTVGTQKLEAKLKNAIDGNCRKHTQQGKPHRIALTFGSQDPSLSKHIEWCGEQKSHRLYGKYI